MLNKLQITGKIEVVTGMHIGGNDSFSAIGAVDSPVIKDVLTGDPIIPGSTLKGKMRTLLARQYNESYFTKCEDDCEAISSLFGSSKKGNIRTSRLLFSDMKLSNWDELKKYGLISKTEVKFENTINRATAVANPRQIERVIRGSEFDLDIIYEAYDDIDEKVIINDFKMISDGFRLLTYDYIGGNGSRGYGKVKIKDLEVKQVIGQLDKEVLKSCENILNGVD